MQTENLISMKSLMLTALPIAMLVLSGLIVIKKNPSKAFRSTILHFAAGVVFSVVSVEILPDMVRIHNTVALVAGFIIGIAAMLLIKRLTADLERDLGNLRGKNLLPWGLLTGVGIDLLLDGILLGVGFAAGAKEGLLLALALALECFSLGVTVSGELKLLKLSNRQIIYVQLLAGVLFAIGTGTGAFVLHAAGEGVLEFVLSFGSAALLFLVTEELLVEAHEQKDTPVYTATFFAGFLLFLVLGLVV